MVHRTPVAACLGLQLLAAISLPAADTNALHPGLPNFHQVDDRVYRGARPTPEGLKSLPALGIKTVIDLRGGDFREKQTLEALGIRYVNVPMSGFRAPTDRQIARILALLETPDFSAAPVFVHCKRGKDRTGTVIACYRIKHQGWDNRKALSEARSFGMGASEVAMQRYILRFNASALTHKSDMLYR
jgi:protein tyrosine/serine phosphatase